MTISLCKVKPVSKHIFVSYLTPVLDYAGFAIPFGVRFASG
jgi:hypothetical protein